MWGSGPWSLDSSFTLFPFIVIHCVGLISWGEAIIKQTGNVPWPVFALSWLPSAPHLSLSSPYNPALPCPAPHCHREHYCFSEHRDPGKQEVSQSPLLPRSSCDLWIETDGPASPSADPVTGSGVFCTLSLLRSWWQSATSGWAQLTPFLFLLLASLLLLWLFHLLLSICGGGDGHSNYAVAPGCHEQ